MSHIEAGPSQPDWRKSRRSMGNGDCVEVGHSTGKVLVRDSKNSAGPKLEYSAQAWRNFLTQAKRGTLG